MSFLAFYASLHVITIFLLLFFAVVVLTLRRGSIVGRGLFAALLASLALSYMDVAVAVFQDFFLAHFPHAFHLGMSFDFAIGPLLWLYVVSRTNASFALRPAHAVHAIPFVLHAGMMTVRFHQYGANAKRAILETGGVFGAGEVELLYVLVHVHLAAYGILALRPALQYRRILRQNYSTERSNSWSWFTIVIVGFLMVWSLRFINGMLWMQIPDWMSVHYIEVRPLIVIGMFAFACMLFIQAMRAPQVLYAEEKVKYRNALLSAEEQRQHADLLRRYMEEHRPFLDSALDLRMLAEGVSLAPQQVSQVLNVSLEQNFFDFVNGYRVRESQRLLRDPRHAGKNIAEIMFESGFNSKSVFNTAFKRATGMTPTQYRKSSGHFGFDPGRQRRSTSRAV